MSEYKHQIGIVGGGTAGITVAASLQRQPGGANLDIALIEPETEHYYQPAFTLVGAGAYTLDKVRREEQALIPSGVNWIKAKAASFEPDQSSLRLDTGHTVSYDYLVMCPGLELNWEKIAGAAEALGHKGVCSNYSPQHVEYTWSCIQQLKPGAKAVFTQAPLPFKCPGAPQKIAYLAADYLQKRDMLKECKVDFFTHAPGLFAVPMFAKELVKIAERYGIDVHYQHNLVAIDGANNRASFEVVGTDRQGEIVTIDYDMLHVTPPQSPAAVVKNSALANDAGFIDVHQHTLQHTKYNNVFALGDAGSTPNSKTAAAVRKQAPVVVKHLLALINGRSLDREYDGYGSCPLTTSYGKVIMAEFTYGGKVTPTFPLDPRKERWLNWWIKVTGLPLFYWYYMLKGREWFFKHNTSYIDPTL
jgi:sulfide:quinone oxidoreductase